MPPTLTCPDHATLERLLAGSPTDPPADALFAHIEQCQSCIRTLFDLGKGDTLPDLIKAGVTLATTPDAEAVEPLVRRLLNRPEDFGTTEVLSMLSPPQAAGELGRLGEYRVRKVLGQGGMGAVFQADDPRLDRSVALKVMLPAVANKPGMKDRFLREARSAAALEHDHVIPIYEVNEANGVPYIAMPLLKGGTLADRLRAADGPLPLNELMGVGRQIATGLAAAHTRGLVHRDIKPENVWLETPSGRVKILDFGLARSDTDHNLTQSGAILGTPLYMAPEQARGEPLDGRADLFSLGVVLFRMATGRLPFQGTTTLAVLNSLANDTPPPVRELNPQVPPTLSRLIQSLLAKKPTDRPATAQAVIAELDALATATSQPTILDDATATKLFEPAPTVGRVHRRPWVVVAVAAVVLVLAGVSFGIYKFTFETKDGTLVVEVDDAADLRFKQGKLEVYDANGTLKYTLSLSEKNKTLPPGQYKVQVVGVDGLKLETTEFEIVKDKVRTLRVTAEPVKVAQADPPKPPEPTADGIPDFAGKVVFRDTFESEERCLLPLADGPPKRAVKGGRYVVSLPAPKAGDVVFTEIGPRVKVGAFAARVRLENGGLFLNFRARGSDTKNRWLSLDVQQSGEWAIRLRRQDFNGDQPVDKPSSVLAPGPAADPALVAGKWFAVAVRWTETEYEVWLNGKRVAGGPLAQAELADGNPIPVQVGIQAEHDGPAKLEFEYAAVWDQAGLPKPSPGEADFHTETAFPGKVVFRDTFDSKEACKLPLADGPPVKKEVKDGRYTVAHLGDKATDNLLVDIGPRVKVGAFAVRARAENGQLFVNFRTRATRESNVRWHTVQLSPAGAQSVVLNRQPWDKTQWGKLTQSVLQSSPPDPVRATGQWVTLAARWSETEYEVWLNGKRVAGGAADPAEVTATTMPIQVCVRPADTGPAKLELEFAAVWDQTGLPVSAVGPAFAAAEKRDTLQWVLGKRKPGTGHAAQIVVDGKPVWLESGSAIPAGDFIVTAVELHRMFSEPISDDDLKRIGALTGLRKLNIGAQPITAAGLKHLKGLTDLTELDIWGQPPEAAAEVVRGYDKLGAMCLPGEYADEWVEALAGKKSLQFLYCTHGKLSVKGVAGFRNLPALTGITLARMDERIAGFLPELEKNDRLRSISFDVVSDATKAKIDEFAKKVPGCEIRYTHNGKEVVLPAGRK